MVSPRGTFTIQRHELLLSQRFRIFAFARYGTIPAILAQRVVRQIEIFSVLTSIFRRKTTCVVKNNTWIRIMVNFGIILFRTTRNTKTR